jgi:Ca2+-binding RTX toxin-like protein
VTADKVESSKWLLAGSLDFHPRADSRASRHNLLYVQSLQLSDCMIGREMSTFIGTTVSASNAFGSLLGNLAVVGAGTEVSQALTDGVNTFSFTFDFDADTLDVAISSDTHFSGIGGAITYYDFSFSPALNFAGASLISKSDNFDTPTISFTGPSAFKLTYIDDEILNGLSGFSLDFDFTDLVVTANSDSFSTTGSTSINGNVLSNDTHSEGDDLKVQSIGSIAGSAGGIFVLNADGTFTFDPNGDFNWLAPNQTVTTTATYTATDSNLANLLSAPGSTSSGVITVTIRGTSHPTTSVVRGDAQDNWLQGTSGKDYIDGLGGNDAIFARSGNDSVLGGNGSDTIGGGGGNDFIQGGGGNDIGFAGMGDDTAYGGEGNDILYGGDGHDSLYGGEGDDLVFGGSGNDLVKGANGNDVLGGGSGNDTINGGAGHDTLYGGEGNDRLSGDMGSDRLFGGAGRDSLSGGIGNDILSGGSGSDIFIFGRNEGRDTIRDFDATARDKIDLEGQTYTVSANSEGFAVLALSGGGSITLNDIAVVDVKGDWFL